jgi:RNA-directed DNA polymerase
MPLANVETVRAEATAVLEPMGVRLSPARTQIVHLKKMRSLTHRCSQADYPITLIRINQIQRGRATNFRYAVAKDTFDRLQAFVWSRVVHSVVHRHRKTSRPSGDDYAAPTAGA